MIINFLTLYFESSSIYFLLINYVIISMNDNNIIVLLSINYHFIKKILKNFNESYLTVYDNFYLLTHI